MTAVRLVLFLLALGAAPAAWSAPAPFPKSAPAPEDRLSYQQLRHRARGWGLDVQAVHSYGRGVWHVHAFAGPAEPQVRTTYQVRIAAGDKRAALAALLKEVRRRGGLDSVPSLSDVETVYVPGAPEAPPTDVPLPAGSGGGSSGVPIR
jgi:hypothetical protein